MEVVVLVVDKVVDAEVEDLEDLVVVVVEMEAMAAAVVMVVDMVANEKCS